MFIFFCIIYIYFFFSTWESVLLFCVVILVVTLYFFNYTAMEVVPPVGMLVYIAVYTLAADVLLLIHPRTAVCFNVG